ncbi:tRNA (adenosine(37)-N6)-threonylcarbamoyltransferase complex dimerization subunit type 1 TsaB [Gilvimarinus polysaccharolyticus]|uniref:tRNA (adenosine(37)-N6)-threonylcarbamoyltransferase complex dimerization subunit type 1 TsaB n=1 Tax=Gilvimarinus polysaccharolyticus TaxID=863921 RepID=UPI000B10FE8A|nr:tRNA (adenosine(37)-N6)-threonylcarbamoyltransferase complex dimerization subunit type 1 TsaB [Gilvimarinus polysaccharolyticus]
MTAVKIGASYNSAVMIPMAKILALDTSSDACSVAYSDGKQLIDRYELAAKSHTQRVLPMVAELLADVGVKVKQLDAIAFGAGPGSFTGLRIGLGVVQGLAFGADVPVLPVSTLMAMAYGRTFRDATAPVTQVLSALDARMGEVYWGLYQCTSPTSIPLAVCADRVAAPDSVADFVPQDSPFVGVGSGWSYEPLAALTDQFQIDVYPSARDIVQLAAMYYETGAALPVDQVQPVYLRNEITWKKRQRIRSQV